MIPVFLKAAPIKTFRITWGEYPDTKITEMDTVVGPEGSSKVLLTLHFCNADFMMAYLLDSKESIGVEKTFDKINKANSSIR